MADDKLEKKREAAFKANEDFALSLAAAKEDERKFRNGRFMKFGIVALQFIDAGDTTLLARLEEAVLQQFGKRRVDRLDFALDERMNWFDAKREELMVKKSRAAKGPSDSKVPSHAIPSASAVVALPAPATKTASAAAPRGTGAPPSGAVSNSAPSSAANG